MLTVVVCLLVGVSAAMATKQNCTAFKINRNVYIYHGVLGGKTLYQHGEYIRILRCKVRQRVLVGNRVRNCYNGKWTGRMPRCIKRRPVVRCKRLPYFKNGRVRGTWSLRVNARKTFRCSRGYIQLGPRELKCLASGKWNGQIPRCLKDINCPYPGTPTNGFRFGSSFKNGRTVKYSCNKDFKLKGSRSRLCMSTGKWSGRPARCKKIDPLKDLANNLKKNFVNKFGLVTIDSRARSGIASGVSGLDFVFVLDSSASVGRTNFKRGIKFVETIIREYGVSTDAQGTRVAIVTFHTTPHVWYNLKTNIIKDINQTLKALDALQFQGGGTDIALALGKVYHVVLPETRKRTKKVLFLITDGHSNVGSHPREMARRLREKMFEIFTIRITKDADERELKSIATQPYRSHIYLLADYATLEQLKDLITGDGDTWTCGEAGNTGLRESLKTPKRKLSIYDAWPWQAAIYVQSHFQCGGTLIADKWVLTSARCFDNNKINNLTKYHVLVSLGNYDRSEGEGTEQDIDAVKIFRQKNSIDDLALIKLNHVIKESSFVHHICLDENPDSTLIWPTQYGVITGWGSKKSPGIQAIPGSDMIYQTVVKFVSTIQCKKMTKYDLKGNVFCGTSQNNTVNECLGDTGGPVMAKSQDETWVLVGVMKYNEGCSAGMKYSAFTKVGHYSNWIATTILNNP